jgi:hypothetical protein
MPPAAIWSHDPETGIWARLDRAQKALELPTDAAEIKASHVDVINPLAK